MKNMFISHSYLAIEYFVNKWNLKFHTSHYYTILKFFSIFGQNIFVFIEKIKIIKLNSFCL